MEWLLSWAQLLLLTSINRLNPPIHIHRHLTAAEYLAEWCLARRQTTLSGSQVRRDKYLSLDSSQPSRLRQWPSLTIRTQPLCTVAGWSKGGQHRLKLRSPPSEECSDSNNTRMQRRQVFSQSGLRSLTKSKCLTHQLHLGRSLLQACLHKASPHGCCKDQCSLQSQSLDPRRHQGKVKLATTPQSYLR